MIEDQRTPDGAGGFERIDAHPVDDRRSRVAQMLLRNTPDPMAVLDVNDRLASWNDAFARKYRLDRCEGWVAAEDRMHLRNALPPRTINALTEVLQEASHDRACTTMLLEWSAEVQDMEDYQVTAMPIAADDGSATPEFVMLSYASVTALMEQMASRELE